MKIKSFFKDLMGAFLVKEKRENAIDKTPSKEEYDDPISLTAKELHPGKIKLKISSIKEVTGGGKTIRFICEDASIPLFQAGQYMTLQKKIGSSEVTRPYSISSAPFETEIKSPFIEITAKTMGKNGFFSTYLLNETKIGDVFISEIGLGDFYYNSLIDTKNVVGIAGGSGITPFLSMAREIKNGNLDINLTILHGSVKANQIFLKEELEECICDKVRIVDVVSDDETWEGEKGFIDSELINKHSEKDSTYFVCGPQKMQDFLRKEFIKLNIPTKRTHFDYYGPLTDVSSLNEYPQEAKNRTYSIKVLRGIKVDEIKAFSNESIATSLERAGIKIHAGCRSGVCGFCRIKVISGEYFIPAKNDMRRASDKEFNYVYSCSTYPLSDLTIRINID